MSSTRQSSPVVSPDRVDRDYARQYNSDFVGRWDELIDWDKRAAGEGTFFVDQLLSAGVCRVFDASTGSGFHAVQLSKAGFDVTACDGSPTMVERAKANFSRHGLDIPVHCSDWRQLDPDQMGTFDAVLCLGSSLCHVFDADERIEVLKRFRSLLKPGGLLLIDQRNFQAILGGHFSSSGQYYYCGKTAKVTLGELNSSLCEFVYTFADGARYRLRVFPILPRRLRSEMKAAGFVVDKTFGDFKCVYDPMRADFIIHQAHDSRKSHLMNSPSQQRVSHDNLFAYDFTHDVASRASSNTRVVWLTGLSAAGKSTIVDSLNPRLQARGLKTCILDGDSLRSGLCRDLGFSVSDRDENVRRVAEVAALMADAGLTVLVALISPTRAARHHARSIVGTERFVEVFVDAPLAVAEARDPKGLYRRARQGEIRGFTGIDSAYEVPVFPELHVHSDQVSAAVAADMIDDWLQRSDND